MKDPMDPVTGRNRAIRSDITPLLRVEALKILREGPILRRIDWQVQPGEHWVILGANGSGKTSLISALAGHLAPTSGQVRVLGETFGHTDWRELRKSIGLVSPYVSERIGSEETVLDITLGGRYATIGLYSRAGVAERTRATEVLAGVGCSALARRSWATLSQGERKRVLIARSLMCDYRVLILDEPCAFLDPVAREQFLCFVRRILQKKRGPAVVLVTHHVEEILPEFTHLLLLKKGRVLTAGSVTDTLTAANLEKTFDSKLRLERAPHGRYLLRAPAGSVG